MKLLTIRLSIFFFLVYHIQLAGQVDSSRQNKTYVTTKLFLDIFYSYDFAEPSGAIRSPYLFNHNRHNEFNVNLALLHFEINNKRYRTHFGMHTGTYALDNYAVEPDLLRNIYEANIGVRLESKGKWWLDFGVLPSYMGFESAISVENPTLTRSLSAENSPYFVTGAKVTYTPNDQLQISGLIMNGWQRIQRVQGNSLPSFGTHITYTPTSDVLINSSSFIGTDDADEERRMRYFHNLFGRFNFTPRMELIVGFDFGIQQNRKGSSTYNEWYTPTIIATYILNKDWATALRAEYFSDGQSIIAPSQNQEGFQTFGASCNLDYTGISSVVCRVETRWLKSKDQIFEAQSGYTNSTWSITASIAYTLKSNGLQI